MNPELSRRDVLGAMAAVSLPSLPPVPSPYEDCTRDAVKWLMAQAVETEHGLVWPATAGKKDTVAYDLYSGSAGVVLLLGEAAKRWRDPAISSAALKGVAELEAAAESTQDEGLYTGRSGMAWVVHRCLLQLPKGQFHAIPFRSPPGKVNDVISGEAGWGLAFLETWEWLYDRGIWQMWRSLAESLQKRAIPVGRGYKWMIEEGGTREMPNFSHGTAGVAFFFGKLHPRVHNDYRYLVIAEKGANYLLSIANDDGLIYHADPDGKSRYYLGWCHGPGGTSQLFWQLHKASGEAKWRDFALRQAEALLALGVPVKRHEGYWNNEGLCCGTAGIGRYFLDTFRRTGDKRFHEAAKRCADVILQKAIRDEQGARWSFAEHRVRPQEEAIQTGWMQGAAGIAAFLMEMGSPKKPIFRLPIDADPL